jgi:hypothetical protein
MWMSRRIAGALLAASTMLLALPRIALAQDADTQEVLRYTLTEAGLAKYIQATKKLVALPGSGCDDEDSESQPSLDAMVARLETAPGAKAAVQSVGMAPREYVLFSMSLLHNGIAAWAVSQPGGKLPPGASQANVDFVNNHSAQLKQLETLEPEDDCGEESEEEITEE